MNKKNAKSKMLEIQRGRYKHANTSSALCIEVADSNSTKPKQDCCCWKEEKSIVSILEVVKVHYI